MVASAPEQPLGRLRPGVFGPTVAGGKPRNGGPDWARIGLLAIATITAFAVLVSTAYAALIFLELRQIQGGGVDIVEGPEGGFMPETPGQELDPVDVDPVPERTTILLVGSDSRDGLSDEQLAAIGTDETGTDLTDTIILLQLDPETDTAAMLSFPRDLVVERCNGTRGRINQAYAIGEEQAEGFGPACLVRTIQALTRIEVDHYVRVNFAGFVTAVDAIGGVSFYVDEPIQDRFSGIDIPEPGCVHFDGVKALQFVRARRVDNDFGRIARQQRFAREMVRQATSVGTLANPVRVTQLITSISEVLETDENFGINDMVDLATSVQRLTAGGIDGRTVPAVEGNLGEADVVYAVEDEAEELYRAFRQGDLLPDDVGTDPDPVELTPQATIPIAVRNGSDIDGLAAETAEVLEDLGFTVDEVGEAPNYGFASSLVLFPQERRAHAELLAETLGGIAVNAGTADSDTLTLIVGSAFDPQEFAPDEPVADASEEEGSAEGEGSDGEDTADLSDDEFTGAEVSDVAC
jgi:LCP family protein required for cell wall assembly